MSGDLVSFNGTVPWASSPRVFLMSRQLSDQIAEGRASVDARRATRWEKLEADIAHFVDGGYVNWGLMKWLVPKKYEHWTLRSVRPKPSLRVFGRFAEPDVFVGTHAVERKNLGKKWSMNWEFEKLACEDVWKRLFTCPPFSASRYEGYITENARQTVRLPS